MFGKVGWRGKIYSLRMVNKYCRPQQERTAQPHIREESELCVCACVCVCGARTDTGKPSVCVCVCPLGNAAADAADAT